MKFKGLDLNLVIALNALLTEKSVSAAARKIALGQPATSGALAKLREHFKDEILVPHGRGMVLTSFGLSLIDPVRRLMVEIEMTLGAREDFNPQTSRRSFRIYVSDYVLEVIAGPISTIAEELAPGVILEFVRPTAVAQALEEGGIDIAIGPERYLSQRYDMDLFIEDTYCVVGDVNNPHLRKSMTAKQFFALNHVSVRFGRDNTPTYAELQINRQPHRRNVVAITSALSAVPILIAGTQRIALLQRTLAKSYALRYPLAMAEPPFEIEPLRQFIQHHEAAKLDPGVQWLQGLIVDYAQRHLAPSP